MYFLMEKEVKLFGFILILLCLDHTKFQGGSYDGWEDIWSGFPGLSFSLDRATCLQSGNDLRGAGFLSIIFLHRDNNVFFLGIH